MCFKYIVFKTHKNNSTLQLLLKEHSGENANNKLPWKNCSEGAFQGQGEIKT